MIVKHNFLQVVQPSCLFVFLEISIGVDYVRSEGGGKSNYFRLLNVKPPEAISQIMMRLLPLGKASPTAELTLSPED